MQNKNSTSLIAVILFVMFSAFILTACSGNSSDKAAADSSTMQSAPMQDTSSMRTDTSMMDTASTRPVKGPN